MRVTCAGMSVCVHSCTRSCFMFIDKLCRRELLFVTTSIRMVEALGKLRFKMTYSNITGHSEKAITFSAVVLVTLLLEDGQLNHCTRRGLSYYDLTPVLPYEKGLDVIIVTLCHACYPRTRRAEVRRWTSLFSHCACFRPSLLEGLRFNVRLVSLCCMSPSSQNRIGGVTTGKIHKKLRAENLGHFVA